MAKLKVSIVVRTKDSDGKRGWVPATGKNDPAGPLYLRPLLIIPGFFARSWTLVRVRVLWQPRSESAGGNVSKLGLRASGTKYRDEVLTDSGL